jgi:hypothetical protein
MWNMEHNFQKIKSLYTKVWVSEKTSYICRAFNESDF